ncbi:putative Transposase-containing protein 29 [Homarus americanus]|uniref:Putative Transposase-containing protein 29 n=1 Tax=Homarus americanus TaxID=6706 RepID=A0A8J5JHR9_HOMAM|nr:putative Transposase-containing protein 29 [Homarus americanus]
MVRRHQIPQRVHKSTGLADRPEVINKRRAIIGMRDAGKTMAAIARATGLNIKTVTKWIRSHLNECGIRCCIPAKKEKLTQANKESRLEFPRHYTQDVHDEHFWNSVIWTDEQSFMTTVANTRVCWQPLNTRYAAPNILGLRRSGRCSRSQAAIVNHAIAEWENLRRLPNYCQRLVDSVSERLNTIIEANGGWGKY